MGCTVEARAPSAVPLPPSREERRLDCVHPAQEVLLQGSHLCLAPLAGEGQRAGERERGHDSRRTGPRGRVKDEASGRGVGVRESRAAGQRSLLEHSPVLGNADQTVEVGLPHVQLDRRSVFVGVE